MNWCSSALFRRVDQWCHQKRGQQFLESEEVAYVSTVQVQRLAQVRDHRERGPWVSRRKPWTVVLAVLLMAIALGAVPARSTDHSVSSR